MKAFITATRKHGLDMYRPSIQWANGTIEHAEFMSEAYARNWIAAKLYRAMFKR